MQGGGVFFLMRMGCGMRLISIELFIQVLYGFAAVPSDDSREARIY